MAAIIKLESQPAQEIDAIAPLLWLSVVAIVWAAVYGCSLGACSAKQRPAWQDSEPQRQSPGMRAAENPLMPPNVQAYPSNNGACGSHPTHSELYRQQLQQSGGAFVPQQAHAPNMQQPNMQQPPHVQQQQLYTGQHSPQPHMQQQNMPQQPHMQQQNMPQQPHLQYQQNAQQPMHTQQQPYAQPPAYTQQQPHTQQLPYTQPQPYAQQPPYMQPQPYVQQQHTPQQPYVQQPHTPQQPHIHQQQPYTGQRSPRPQQPHTTQAPPYHGQQAQQQLPFTGQQSQKSSQSSEKPKMPMVLCANCRAKLYAPAGGIFKCPHCMATQRLPPELLNSANVTLGSTCNVPGCSCQNFTLNHNRAMCAQCGHKKSMHKVAKDDISVEIGLPVHWEGDTTKSLRKQVPMEIKQAVQDLMNYTWKDVATKDRKGDKHVCKYEVVQVLRNQNPKLWIGYALKREVIRAELVGKTNHRIEIPKTSPFHENARQADHPFGREPLYTDCNEMFLFHGTKPSAADSIAENAFKLSFSGSNRGTLFGPGIYFAESSTKSDEYAQDDQEGLYQGLYATLLCRVVMGSYAYCAEHRPDADALTKSCLEGGSHSVLGDREKIRGTFREFVVFDHEQAYPEFIVIYRRLQ